MRPSCSQIQSDAIALGVLFVLYYLFFLLAWLIKSGEISLEVTFSELLATQPTVQILFLCFYTLYVIYSTILTLVLLDDDRHVGIIQHHQKHHVYRAGAAVKETLESAILTFTILGILSQLTAVLSLIFVFFYPVTTENAQHDIAASIAFVSIWFTNACYYIRRRLLRWYLSESNRSIWAWLNLMRLMGALGLLIAFAVITPRDGRLEFSFAVLVLLEPADEIIDLLTSGARARAAMEKI